MLTCCVANCKSCASDVGFIANEDFRSLPPPIGSIGFIANEDFWSQPRPFGSIWQKIGKIQNWVKLSK